MSAEGDGGHAVDHDAAMLLAIEQAQRVKGNTYPNPPVGAVILDRDGRVVGVGEPVRPARRTPKWWRCAGPVS